MGGNKFNILEICEFINPLALNSVQTNLTKLFNTLRKLFGEAG